MLGWLLGAGDGIWGLGLPSMGFKEDLVFCLLPSSTPSLPETGPPSVAQVGLELILLLPPPLECWDDKCAYHLTSPSLKMW